MKVQLESTIIQRWPDWFRLPDGRCSLMGQHIQCGDGWFGLLVSTFARIEPHVAVWNQELAACGSQFEILEIKQKFGELWITAMPTNEPIFTTLLDARVQSRHICENCSAPGSLRTEGYRGWVRCDRCNFDRHENERCAEHRR
jgi:hypothetical protein